MSLRLPGIPITKHFVKKVGHSSLGGWWIATDFPTPESRYKATNAFAPAALIVKIANPISRADQGMVSLNLAVQLLISAEISKR